MNCLGTKSSILIIFTCLFIVKYIKLIQLVVLNHSETVHTKKLSNVIEVKVQDNGNGISSSIVNKIFQPFFTTKPAGQGTSLGLSLAYDIVKAHGGVPIVIGIKVESVENIGTEFIVNLPNKAET